MRIILISILLTVLVAAQVVAKDEAPTCDNCGMFWLKSPTAVSTTVSFEGKKHEHLFECLGCLHDKVHELYGDKAQIEELEILDYTTFATGKENMLDAFDAMYLFGTSRLKGSMPPYIAAFATKKSAEAKQDELGGQLVDFKGMQKLMREFKGEKTEGHDGHDHGDHGAEQGEDAVFVCSCSGGCCSDIVSDKPGTCPKCGMELKLK